MGSFNRSIKRKKEVKKKKALKKGLREVARAVGGMPSSCTMCEKKFDKEENPDEWFMSIKEGHFILTCPDCSPSKSF